jgi:hypothetical protein
MRFLSKTACILIAMPAMTVLAGCDLVLGEPKSACALGEGDRASSVTLTAADCADVQAAFAAQRVAQQAAAAQGAEADRTQAIRKFRADVAARIRQDEENGFRATSVENFKLNGQDLAHTDTKVAVQGFYVKTSRGEFLMPSALATSQIDMNGTPDEGINLLSTSASRAAKRAFVQCQKDAVKSRLGCPMTVLGEAVLCERTTIFGMAQAPCIAVDDSWYIPPPD